MRELVRAALNPEEFDVQEASHGEEALRLIRERQPDVVVCDYRMPTMDGLEFVRRLRADPFRRQIIVLMLTSEQSVDATVTALEAGADDYLTKPFRGRELAVRVHCLLRRRERDLSSDPLTRLPSGLVIRRELQDRINRGVPFAAIYADLDYFKPYVDKFEFIRAGDAILRSANLFNVAVREAGGPTSFVGHIAGDDFVAACPLAAADGVCQRVIKDYSAMSPSLYFPEEAVRGRISGNERDGRPREFPWLAISLCIVDTLKHPVQTAGEIADLTFSAKPTAKAITGSSFVRG